MYLDIIEVIILTQWAPILANKVVKSKAIVIIKHKQNKEIKIRQKIQGKLLNL
jgi:hypothetical protein